MTRLNIIGDRYGRLTVIKEVEPKAKKRYFLCKCDCGQEKEIYMNSLRNGTTKSCGCLKKEQAVKTHTKDLSNQRFGRLVAKKIVGKNEEKSVNIWECICDCGETKTVRTDHLLSGEVQSCGCLKKELEEQNLLRKERDYVEGQNVFLLKDTLYKNNTSGVRGVSFDKRSGLWRAYIRVKNTQIELGMFKNKADAINARKKAEEKYHKPYLE